MAGRSSKKNQSNLEKIRMEMAAKKQKAQDKCTGEVIENIEIDKGDTIKEKEFGVEIVAKVQQDEKENSVDNKKIELVVFRVDEEEFALRISNIKEIIRVPLITKVPDMPPNISGLCSLRNELLPVIDCRGLFGMPVQEFSESSRIIVADIYGKKAGLISDKVLEVLNVEEASIIEPPASIKGIDGEIVNGILVLNEGKRIVMILDAEKMIKDIGKVLMSAGETDSEKDSEKDSKADGNLEHIVAFKLGEEEYGIDINNVQEIKRMSEITHFPGAPYFIEGMVDLRGDIIPILNLRKLFGVHNSDFYNNSNSYNSDSYNESKFLVVELGNKKIGILIDSVSEVLKFSKKYLEEAPKVFKKNDHNSYIERIAKLNDGERIVLILNLSALLNI